MHSALTTLLIALQEKLELTQLWRSMVGRLGDIVARTAELYIPVDSYLTLVSCQVPKVGLGESLFLMQCSHIEETAFLCYLASRFLNGLVASR